MLCAHNSTITRSIEEAMDMKQKLNAFVNSEYFRIIILLFLACALIEIILVLSGFLVNRYYLNVSSYFDILSMVNLSVVSGLLVIEKVAHFKNEMNGAILRFTFFVSILASFLVICYAKPYF